VNFHKDAIVLSGETGTKLKCEVLSGYYPLWWRITSGGDYWKYGRPTAIIEMNAGTALDYIEETKKTILGSSGHAMEVKANNEHPTSKLRIVLVEQSDECFSHLKNVISKRWGTVNLDQALGKISLNKSGVYLINKDPSQALDIIEKIPDLGNALFFFDPLLYTSWDEIERVAARRITRYYQTQTEFIVFLFTSDWFDGRKKAGLVPLPDTIDEKQWSAKETATVNKMDDLFGNWTWRAQILTKEARESRMEKLVQAYRKRLHHRFRYVLPLPFNPKEEQIYHLFMCSNFEDGVRITRNYYSEYTGNPRYNPDANAMYDKFKILHPELLVGYTGNQRPIEWRFLNMVIQNHEEGLCDIHCRDLWPLVKDWPGRIACLNWLAENGYLERVPRLTLAWIKVPFVYKANWDVIKKRLDEGPPPKFSPLKSKDSEEEGDDEDDS
jgi:three-Cys-motif partner protein